MKALIQVVILFSLVGVGYICKKLKIISNNMNNDVSNLLVYVSLPALIIVSFSSFEFSDAMLKDGSRLFIICLVLNILYIIMSYIFTKILGVKDTTKDVLQFALVFTNAGFMGFPIAYVVFGEIGVFYIAIFNMLSDIFLWTFGVKVMSRPLRTSNKEDLSVQSTSLLKQLMNPCIVAVLIGIVLFLTSVKLPLPIHNSLELVGGVTTPLAMIFIGSMLGDLEFKDIIADTKVLQCTLIRLIVLPLIVLGILKFFNINGLLFSVPVLATALPVAVGSSIVAAKYGNDYYLASKVVFISTLFSIVTIPFFIWIL
ncbi:AEC family transporter [Wukongibacter baidiensis]|uniref:AEC family transporter n=1 Tax=Wukongibacter baidiensis TaxID=1723361 RepID=UPI003D7F491B